MSVPVVTDAAVDADKGAAGDQAAAAPAMDAKSFKLVRSETGARAWRIGCIRPALGNAPCAAAAELCCLRSRRGSPAAIRPPQRRRAGHEYVENKEYGEW